MKNLKGLKVIGKGAFSKCWLNADNVTVTLKSVCPVKEVMAMGWFPDSTLFPTLKRDDDSYIMKYYPRVSSLRDNLDSTEYELYKELRAVHLSYNVPSNQYDGYQVLYDAFSKLGNEDLREAMLAALDSVANCGSDIGFEISPRNVATDNGKLVLLDVFYMQSALAKVRKRNAA